MLMFLAGYECEFGRVRGAGRFGAPVLAIGTVGESTGAEVVESNLDAIGFGLPFFFVVSVWRGAESVEPPVG